MIKNYIYKSVCWLLILSLLMPVSSGSASEIPIDLPTDSILTPQSFSLSSDLGQVDLRINGYRDPLIVLIPDAHCVTDIQYKIRDLIRSQRGSAKSPLIAIEGAAGKLEPALLRSFPDDELRDQVLSEYLERGEVTGTEFSVSDSSSQEEAYGLEDWELYQDNYQAYLDVVAVQEEQITNLSKRQSRLDRIRSKLFSKEIALLHRDYLRYRQDVVTLPNLLESMKRNLPAEQTHHFLGMESLYQLMEAEKYEDHAFRDELIILEKQMLARKEELSGASQRKLARLSQTLRTERSSLMRAARDMLELSKQEKMSGAFVSSLLQDRVDEYAQLLQASEELDLSQFQRFFTALPGKMQLDKKASKLWEIYENNQRLWELSNLSLSSSAWAEARDKAGRSHPAWTLESDKIFRTFYELAESRDAAMSENLFNLIDLKSPDLVFVVAGGFHAEGIMQRILREGYSLVRVRINGLSLTGQEHYAGLMQGKSSFSENRNQVSFESFMRHVAGQLMQSVADERRRKEYLRWRSQIVRQLSQPERSQNLSAILQIVDNEFLKLDVKTETSLELDKKVKSARLVLRQFQKNIIDYNVLGIKHQLDRPDPLSSGVAKPATNTLVPARNLLVPHLILNVSQPGEANKSASALGRRRKRARSPELRDQQNREKMQALIAALWGPSRNAQRFHGKLKRLIDHYKEVPGMDHLMRKMMGQSFNSRRFKEFVAQIYAADSLEINFGAEILAFEYDEVDVVAYLPNRFQTKGKGVVMNPGIYLIEVKEESDAEKMTEAIRYARDVQIESFMEPTAVQFEKAGFVVSGNLLLAMSLEDYSREDLSQDHARFLRLEQKKDYPGETASFYGRIRYWIPEDNPINVDKPSEAIIRNWAEGNVMNSSEIFEAIRPLLTDLENIRSVPLVRDLPDGLGDQNEQVAASLGEYRLVDHPRSRSSSGSDLSVIGANYRGVQYWVENVFAVLLDKNQETKALALAVLFDGHGETLAEMAALAYQKYPELKTWNVKWIGITESADQKTDLQATLLDRSADLYKYDVSPVYGMSTEGYADYTGTIMKTLNLNGDHFHKGIEIVSADEWVRASDELQKIDSVFIAGQKPLGEFETALGQDLKTWVEGVSSTAFVIVQNNRNPLISVDLTTRHFLGFSVSAPQASQERMQSPEVLSPEFRNSIRRVIVIGRPGELSIPAIYGSTLFPNGLSENFPNAEVYVHDQLFEILDLPGRFRSIRGFPDEANHRYRIFAKDGSLEKTIQDISDLAERPEETLFISYALDEPFDLIQEGFTVALMKESGIDFWKHGRNIATEQYPAEPVPMAVSKALVNAGWKSVNAERVEPEKLNPDDLIPAIQEKKEELLGEIRQKLPGFKGDEVLIVLNPMSGLEAKVGVAGTEQSWMRHNANMIRDLLVHLPNVYLIINEGPPSWSDANNFNPIVGPPARKLNALYEEFSNQPRLLRLGMSRPGENDLVRVMALMTLTNNKEHQNTILLSANSGLAHFGDWLQNKMIVDVIDYFSLYFRLDQPERLVKMTSPEQTARQISEWTGTEFKERTVWQRVRAHFFAGKSLGEDQSVDAGQIKALLQAQLDQDSAEYLDGLEQLKANEWRARLDQMLDKWVRVYGLEIPAEDGLSLHFSMTAIFGDLESTAEEIFTLASMENLVDTDRLIEVQSKLSRARTIWQTTKSGSKKIEVSFLHNVDQLVTLRVALEASVATIADPVTFYYQDEAPLRKDFLDWPQMIQFLPVSALEKSVTRKDAIRNLFIPEGQLFALNKEFTARLVYLGLDSLEADRLHRPVVDAAFLFLEMLRDIEDRKGDSGETLREMTHALGVDFLLDWFSLDSQGNIRLRPAQFLLTITDQAKAMRFIQTAA